MNHIRCCESTPSKSGLQLPAAWPLMGRSCLRAASWLVPGTILALMPKCPACLAAYLAIGTGLALSASTANYLRIGLIILSAVSLLYFLAPGVRRFLLLRRPAATK
jgi:hypothetical protein